MMISLMLTAIVVNLVMQQHYFQFINNLSNKDALNSTSTESDEHTQTLINLSHDMRTPLSGILGMTELL